MTFPLRGTNFAPIHITHTQETESEPTMNLGTRINIFNFNNQCCQPRQSTWVQIRNFGTGLFAGMGFGLLGRALSGLFGFGAKMQANNYWSGLSNMTMPTFQYGAAGNVFGFGNNYANPYNGFLINTCGVIGRPMAGGANGNGAANGNNPATNNNTSTNNNTPTNNNNTSTNNNTPTNNNNPADNSNSSNSDATSGNKPTTSAFKDALNDKNHVYSGEAQNTKHTSLEHTISAETKDGIRIGVSDAGKKAKNISDDDATKDASTGYPQYITLTDQTSKNEYTYEFLSSSGDDLQYKLRLDLSDLTKDDKTGDKGWEANNDGVIVTVTVDDKTHKIDLKSNGDSYGATKLTKGTA